MRFSFLSAMLLLCMLVIPGYAHANLCKSMTTERARTEARRMEDETFAQAPQSQTVDYVGNRAYNADLISCNRQQDSNGNAIEKEIGAGHEFAANLEARSVTGKYNYFATSPLAYAYELRRDKAIWIVRAPMRFHWPDSRKTDMVDISMELAGQLNDATLNRLCASGATVFDSNGKDVTRGRIPLRGDNATGTDTVWSGEDACRVPRALQVNGEGILRHVRRFYADSITRVWNRPGFRVQPVLIDHGEGTQAQINAWDQDGITWELHLNLIPDHRASYKRWTMKWNHMYTGVPSHTIAHEYGHKMGLDDEYGWGPTATRSQRDCSTRDNTLPDEYLMCSQWASQNDSESTDSDSKTGAKAVYVWLVTRRYAVAQELTCKEDTDCGNGRFCAKGPLGVGRNQCETLKQVGGTCDRATQCSTGRCAGGFCAVQHECTADNDCDSNEFCKIGLGNLDQNTCRTKLPDWDACTGDKQCKSGHCSGWRPQDGQTSGICYTPSSRQGGESCKIDLECAAGACNSNKRCVCKQDDDCASNEWCDKGLDLHENSCRAKFDKGQACGKYGDLGVSRRCKSGKCSTGSGLGVPGVTTIYCQ